MGTPASFLSLPRELRNTIYHHYVFEPDGYHFDYDSGKLRASGNRLIDLALMYTCSLVATEMHHLALRSNAIHFYTLDTEPKDAMYFDRYLDLIEHSKMVILAALRVPEFQHYRTSNVDDEVALRYPQFKSLLSLPEDEAWYRWPPFAHCDQGLGGSSWGEADSVFRAFQDYMIHLVLRDTDFPEALANFFDEPHIEPPDLRAWLYRFKAVTDGREFAHFLRRVLRRRSLDPWSIPSKEEFTAHVDTGLSPPLYEDNFWERVRWRFSAAAVAIHFLKTLPQSTCLGMRKIVLHEDRRSVAHPECHVLGLIPFCVQNPQLHIERRVNMWRVLLSEGLAKEGHRYKEILQETAGYGEADKWQHYDRHCASIISKSCCRWITEASAMFTNDMPVGSFSLVLEGDPAPDQGSKWFEILKEDAAWQTANTQWRIDQSLTQNSSIVTITGSGVYWSEVFPQAINNIVEGKSFIRCNFVTGEPCDPRQVLERNRHITPADKWWKQWLHLRYRNAIRPSPPLPALADFALEDVIAEEEQDAA